tara:strand:- start:11274 stop:11993 length:720 start_codon:yes stop_codon:yes gene_type:complete
MIDINSVPKFIINLDNRPDRWNHIVKEFEYMEWEYHRFPGINTGSHVGCAKSHMAVALLGIEKNLDYLMVCEDDIFFLPHAKQHLEDCLKALDKVEWDMFHLAPSLHRPLKMDRNDCLISLRDVPPKEEKHTKIYGLSAVIYKKSLLSEVLKWPLVFKEWNNDGMMQAIDTFFSDYIYPNFNCFCGNLPIVTQIADPSTINRGQVIDNHYLMTYNWKLYANKNLPQRLMDYGYCKKNRQ